MKYVLLACGAVVVGIIVFANELGKWCEDCNPYSPCDECMGATFGDCKECKHG